MHRRVGLRKSKSRAGGNRGKSAAFEATPRATPLRHVVPARRMAYERPPIPAFAHHRAPKDARLSTG